MSGDKVGPGHSSTGVPQPEEETLTVKPAPQMTPQKETKPAPQGAPLRIPQLVRLPATQPLAKTAAPLRETAAMMLERLEPLIQAQVAQITAALEKEHLQPEDVQASVAFNIIGRMEQVCAACGRIGHQYRPVMFAKQNVEMELLEEDFVVATQALARVGVSYAAVVYDEEVLVLREMGPPGESAKSVQDLDLELQRFRAFKNRKSYPDPANRQWLSERLAAWKPEHATQVVVGQSNDLAAISATQKIFNDNPGRGGPKLFLLATSTAPTTGLQGQEFALKKQGIIPAAIAVGNTGAQIADQLFEETVVARDPHDTREMIGSRMTKLIELAAEQEVE